MSRTTVHEKLVRRHNYVLGYAVTKPALRAAGLVSKSWRPNQAGSLDQTKGEAVRS